MELFRIIAMFLVLIVHADFFSLGQPTVMETQTGVLSSGLRIFIQSISIVCVDCFILISGWFGIRPSLEKFLNFLFQCLFFAIGIYGVCLVTGLSTLSLRGIAECFFLTGSSWFVKAYVGLYILAPILNLFIEQASKFSLLRTILLFYLFQTIYGWLTNGADFFEGGYSTMSFIGLYLLGRYVKLHDVTLVKGGGVFQYLAIYLVIAFIMSFVAFFAIRFGIDGVTSRIYPYTNPLVITAALSLLLFFSKLNFQNKFVNWMGISCFGVYLLHTNPNLLTQYFKPTIIYIYEKFDGIASLIVLFLFLAAIFITAILMDKIRIFLWGKIALSHLKSCYGGIRQNRQNESARIVGK